MKNNVYDDLLLRVNALKKKELSIELFREAQVIIQKVKRLRNIGRINEKSTKFIEKEVNEAIFAKLKELNPDLNDSTIANILCQLYKELLIFTRDIIVVGDTILFNENEVDDFEDIVRTRMQIHLDDKEEGYKEITDYIRWTHNFWEKDPSPAKEPNKLNRDKSVNRIKHITDSINRLMQPLLEQYSCKDAKAVSPMFNFYNFETEGVFYELTRLGIFLDHNFNQISERMDEGTPTLIKMIATISNNTYYFEITQTMIDDEPSWEGVEIKIPIWQLSKAITLKRLEKRDQTSLKPQQRKLGKAANQRIQNYDKR